MDNDSKNILMQYLSRFAEHEGIKGAELISFRKREALLAQLKTRNHASWVVITNLIAAFLNEDRISNDKAKKELAYPLWLSEHAGAEKEKVKSEQELIQYCRENKIPVGVNSVALSS